MTPPSSRSRLCRKIVGCVHKFGTRPILVLFSAPFWLVHFHSESPIFTPSTNSSSHAQTEQIWTPWTHPSHRALLTSSSKTQSADLSPAILSPIHTCQPRSEVFCVSKPLRLLLQPTLTPRPSNFMQWQTGLISHHHPSGVAPSAPWVEKA